MPNNPRQPSPNAAPAPRSALCQCVPGVRAWLATLLVLSLFGFPLPSSAQVNLPNGGVSENVVDLRVKTVGGMVTVDRQFEEGRWHINLRWAPAVLSGEAVGSVTCKAYPELKIQGHPYTGDGLNWLRENRYSARVTGYFDGSDCPANRLKTIRWQDRNTGQWMDYERSSTSDLQLKLVRYGNRNDIATQLLYDPQGKLQSVKDHHGNTVLHYLYTGDQLTEIRDNPGLIPATPDRCFQRNVVVSSNESIALFCKKLFVFVSVAFFFAGCFLGVVKNNGVWFFLFCVISWSLNYIVSPFLVAKLSQVGRVNEMTRADKPSEPE